MSLAGVDPTATTGIPGSADAVSQLERTMERVEPVAEKKEDIAHTNITMGIDVLTKQFIYLGTYTWRTTDAPGKVIAMFPIHPDSCNDYTQHVYQMFNAWVGGQKARIRIIGTAFYGGGLYFVRIPPNFTSADINAMNLQGFTAFPHADMDPKVISSIDMDLQDYRQNHFHTGELDLTNSQSFAGWLAIVVNARLVTQSTEISSIDLRVEMAGSYTFQVPRPIRVAQTEASGPLGPQSLNIPALSGCDDMISNCYNTRLVVCPSNLKKVSNGNVFMKRAGGAWTYNLGINASLTQGGPKAERWTNIVTRARNDMNAKTFSALGIPYMRYDYQDSNYQIAAAVDMAPYTPSHGTIQFNWKTINACAGASLTGAWKNTGDESSYYGVLSHINFYADSYYNPIEHVMDFETDSVATHDGTIAIDNTQFVIDLKSLFETTDFMVPNLDDPEMNGESYVCVLTNNGHSASAQAKQWREDLETFTSWPVGNAALYEVVDPAGTVAGYVKLRENGHAYSSAVAGNVAFPVNSKLRFRQWVPNNEPIPVTTYMANEMVGVLVDQKATKLASKVYKKLALNRTERVEKKKEASS